MIDAACDREEKDRELALALARQGVEIIPVTGKCHNCSASVPNGHRFCDVDCRDDWQLRNRHGNTPGAARAGGSCL